MLTYLFMLVSQAEERLEAIVRLHGNIVNITFNGSWNGKALCALLYGIAKKADLRFRVGRCTYIYEDGRVEVYKNGKPVGWANIDFDVLEIDGCIEGLFFWCLRHSSPFTPNWEVADIKTFENIDIELKALNMLLDKGACYDGAFLAQYLATPSDRAWEEVYEANHFALKSMGVEKHLLENFPSFAVLVETINCSQKAKVEAELELPDWLRPS